MTIGEKMGQILFLNKIDNFEIAGEKLGCTRQHISNVVKGEKTPSVQFINSFCYIFGVNKDWLINENNVDLTPFALNDNLIKKITSNYMLLSNECKDIVDNLIDGLLKVQNKDNKNDVPQTLAASSSEKTNFEDNDSSIPTLLN